MKIQDNNWFRFYILLISILAFTARIYAQDSFTIIGKLDSIKSDKIIFLQYIDQGNEIIDSAIIKHGHFHFNGSITEPVKALLKMKTEDLKSKKILVQQLFNADEQEFYLENTTLHIIGDSIKNAIIKGGHNQMLYSQYRSDIGPLLDTARALRKNLNKRKSTLTNEEKELLTAEIDQLEKLAIHRTDTFMNRFPDAFLTLDLLLKRSRNMNADNLEKSFSALSPTLKNSAVGRQLEAKIKGLKSSSIGEVAPDFEVLSDKDKIIHLSSFRGKYLLLDFWASWCVPCRAENPAIKSAYIEFRSKNFEILSISMDNKKNLWLKAIEEDQLPWPQGSDLMAGRSPIALKFGISTIPQNLLIDPSGKIVAKNLHGDNLKKKLRELLK